MEKLRNEIANGNSFEINHDYDWVDKPEPLDFWDKLLFIFAGFGLVATLFFIWIVFVNIFG